MIVEAERLCGGKWRQGWLQVACLKRCKLMIKKAEPRVRRRPE